MSCFYAIGSDAENEIVGHMSLFSRADNPGHYWDSIHKAGKDIRKIITDFRKTL
jgi:hypothetical protein